MRTWTASFGAVVDRTRTRLDVPTLRTLFGARRRPRQYSRELSPRCGVVIETPRWDLTLFKVLFGLLTLKGYTKGEHVLRFEAIVHNTRALGCGRVLERFPEIVARLAAMAERFVTMLDCVDIRFLSDQTLDDLPVPSQIGATRVGGVDLNKPLIRSALAALTVLREQVIGPIVAGVRSPRQGRLQPVQAGAVGTRRSSRKRRCRHTGFCARKRTSRALEVEGGLCLDSVPRYGV